jgi:hypothetical protein
MVTAIGFVSCKKSSSSNPTYYMEATVNGNTVKYNGYTGAVNEAPGMTKIYGFTSNAANSDGITILIQVLKDSNNTATPAGTYTDTANVNDPQIPPDSANNFHGGYFNTNEANIYVQLMGNQYVSNGVADASAGTPFTCTITAIDNKSVTGTFSGFGYYSTSAVAVMSGTFHVSF